MGNQRGQALVEFILILPFLLILMILPFILSDMVEKKYRHRIAAGNLANSDVVQEGGRIDPGLSKNIESLSMGDLVEGDLHYITPNASTIERRSSVYNGFSKALHSESTLLYNPMVNIESFFGQHYSYVTFLLGEITRVKDTNTISQLRSQITYNINPAELDLLLKSTNPTASNGSAEGLPLSLDFTSINFNETLVAYHPSDYKTGGLIGWVLANIHSSRPNWGGSGYSYSWDNLGFGDFSSHQSSTVTAQDFNNLKQTFKSGYNLINDGLDTMGSFIPGVSSRNQAFSISCPFQYRATNHCRVNLFGTGQPLYPMFIELFTAIAAIADVIEEIASGGGAYANKAAIREALKEIANELTNKVVKALEDKARQEVESQVNRIEAEITDQFKDLYERKANELKAKVNNIGDELKASLREKGTALKEGGVNYFTNKVKEFSKNF